MINFNLPNTFDYQMLNLFMFKLTKSKLNYFKVNNINFVTCSGEIPYFSWTGGLNSNYGPGFCYNQLLDFQRTCPGLPYRLNMANVLLEDYDFDDCLGQVILEIFNDGCTMLEISSPTLMRQIHEKYPNYYFMFSKQADLLNEFSPDIIDSIVNSNTFRRIGIPDKYSRDINWLKQISKKNICEITVNPYCTKNCPCRDSCLLTEHTNQIEFSNHSFIEKCSKQNNIFDNSQIISLEEISKTYQPMGFIYFTFNPSHTINNVNFVADFYFNYFIKPEHYLEVLSLWNQEIMTAAQIQEKIKQ